MGEAMRIRPYIAALSPAAAAILHPAAAFGTSLEDGLPGEENAPPDIPDGMDAIGSAVWMIVALVIVIVLIVFTLRFLSSRARTWGQNRSLRSLGGIALGQNKSLQVIEVGGKLYLLGVGENVTLIDRIDDAEEAGRLIAVLENPASQPMGVPLIGEWLNRLRGGRRTPESDNSWNVSEFEAMLRSNLERQAGRKQQFESLVNDSQSKDRLMDE
ncbi:Flagellar biosynthetic protein fliZ [Thermobacillus xylanilyticus]|nr:Flagellar biosynthetic protein fliZ [Thermobacillus xylanilyticus]